jgi:2-polyprenyl-6-methoxyphenol hydroxylase-like FAD-dependent oxidoreductase
MKDAERVMNPIKNVLIVGGGIGGLTLAVALGRQGLRAEVIELKPEHKVFGVGIIQPGNALRALRTLGLMDVCLAEGFQTDHYAMYDAGGDFIARMQLLRIAGAATPAVNGMPRTALHRILTEAAETAGARIRLGLTVSAITSHTDRVDVVLSDGSEETYDLVVGADGIRSHVRQMIFGEEFEPQFTGHGVWRFTVPRVAEVDHQIMLYGVGVKAGVMPVSKEQMYLLLVTNEPGNPWIPPDSLDRLLRERLKPFTAPVVTAIRDQINDPAKVIYGPIEEVILPSPWYRGRVLLIGDAAHASGPHVSQGATMAIEDAIVLAELVGRGLPAETVLTQFMARRYARCKFVQDVSRQVGRDGNIDDPIACAERNDRMRESFRDPSPRPHELRMAEPI